VGSALSPLELRPDQIDCLPVRDMSELGYVEDPRVLHKLLQVRRMSDCGSSRSRQGFCMRHRVNWSAFHQRLVEYTNSCSWAPGGLRHECARSTLIVSTNCDTTD
jgi:hypothetical protein